MIHVKSLDVNELFIRLSKILNKEGSYVSPRNMLTKEIRNVWMEVEDVSNPVITLKSRNLDLEYLKKEFEWYLKGDLDTNEISKASSFWKSIQNDDGTVNSNYGFLALKEKYDGRSQLEWCVDRIREDPSTRQAVINYNQPKHKYEGNKDFVCAISQQFINRNNSLDTIVLMRSNDLIYGLSYDLPWFVHLQKEVARKTEIPIGRYLHYSASLHVYERHFKMVEDMANEDITE